MSTIKAVKGFDLKFRCRDFQFAVGESYTHDGSVVLCCSGFHAVVGNPMQVFEFYEPSRSRFCYVELSGEMSDSSHDGKVAAGQIRIVAELNSAEFCMAASRWAAETFNAFSSGASIVKSLLADSCKGTVSSREAGFIVSARGSDSVAGMTGSRGAAQTSGERSVAAATGHASAAMAFDVGSVAGSTRKHSIAHASASNSIAAATGDGSVAIALGMNSVAAVASYRSMCSAIGPESVAVAAGYGSVATVSSDRCAAVTTGNRCHAVARKRGACAISLGIDGTVEGTHGTLLVATERNMEGLILSVAHGIVGQNGIREGVRYRCLNGKLVEAG